MDLKEGTNRKTELLIIIMAGAAVFVALGAVMMLFLVSS